MACCAPLCCAGRTDVTWGAPAFGWLLLLLLPALILYRLFTRQQARALAAYTGVPARPRPAVSFWLALLGHALLVVALCRPQWGESLVPRDLPAVDLLVALDVSRSMLADDLEPSRLAVAKRAIDAWVDTLEGERVGLIAYAGSAYLVCPPTTDYATFQRVLRQADPATLPLAGSNLGAALREAERAFEVAEAGARHLLVVGDGEDHAGDFGDALYALRALGVTTHGLLVGSARGGLIPAPGGDFHRARNGAIVTSRANADTLRALAAGGGGLFIDLGMGPASLSELHAHVLGSRAEAVRQAAQRLPTERYQYPLALAVVLFVLTAVWGPRRAA